jgi:serine/threonine protein kinase
MFLSVSSNKLLLIKTRLRFTWDCCLRGFLARPCHGRQTSPSRLVTLAHHEVSLLKDADDHPNVFWYYYQEAHPALLADIIEQLDQFREVAVSFYPKRAVHQITSGLRHLHVLKIVHRDIKPQNILISGAKRASLAGIEF